MTRSRASGRLTGPSFVRSRRPDGKRYEGEWFNGKQHGRGVYTNTKGERKEAKWKDGRKLMWIKNTAIKNEDNVLSHN